MKERENTRLMKNVADLEKTCMKLQAELEVERTRTQVSPPSLQVQSTLGSEQRQTGKRKGVADDEDVEQTKPDKAPNVIKKKKRTILPPLSLESDCSSNFRLIQVRISYMIQFAIIGMTR